MGSHSHLPGDLPDPGIESGSLALQADSLSSEPPGKPQKSRGLSNFPIYLFPEADSGQVFLVHGSSRCCKRVLEKSNGGTPGTKGP